MTSTWRTGLASASTAGDVSPLAGALYTTHYTARRSIPRPPRSQKSAMTEGLRDSRKVSQVSIQRIGGPDLESTDDRAVQNSARGVLSKFLYIHARTGREGDEHATPRTWGKLHELWLRVATWVGAGHVGVHVVGRIGTAVHGAGLRLRQLSHRQCLHFLSLSPPFMAQPFPISCTNPRRVFYCQDGDTKFRAPLVPMDSGFVGRLSFSRY